MQMKVKPIVVALAFALTANSHMGWAADESKVGAQDEKTSGETKTSDDSAVTEMSPIQVRGVANGGYKANKSTSGTKVDTPILETPMAVQSVPQEVLVDRQTLSAQEAVKNVSGIQSTSQFYDFFQIRGFFTTGGRFRDGLQLPNVYGGVDMAFVDHVEVAKGPTSMLYGRIEPGGLVNIVTKKPQATTAYSLDQQVGSWGAYRTTADATGKVNPDGSVLYRLIGVYDKADSFVDNVHHNNKAVAASLVYKPNSQFEGNLQLEYYDTKMAEVFMGMGNQIPIIGNRPANLPRNFSSVDPALWSNFPMKVNRTLYAFDWSYAFNDQWKITNRFAYTDQTETQSILYGYFDGVNTINTQSLSYQPGWKRSTYNTNLDLTGEFNTGDLKHNLLLGMDYYDARNDSPGSDGAVAGLPTLNIYNPVFGNSVPALQAAINADQGNIIWRDRTKTKGLYVHDQIALSKRWDLLLGVRHDEADQAYAATYGTRTSACYPNCTGYPIVPQPTDKADSPRIGVLYKLSNETSVYASYSQSFGQSFPPAYSFTNTVLGPEKGIQYELGVKSSLLDGKVTASATYFDLYKRNVIQSDPVNAGFMVAIGEIRSRGLELDISGQVTEHVSIIGSYTFDDAVITKDVSPVPNTQDNTVAGVPLNSASLWAKYDTAPGAPDGWAFGAGAYLNGQRQGDNANSFQLPGYGRVDAMVSYHTKAVGQKVTAQLNVNNLFDKTYFESGGGAMGGGSSGALYGAPRNLMASVKVDFK